MNQAEDRYERLWGTGLIIVGIALLGVVFLSAFGIARDPGEYYDKWVPDSETVGPEASFDWASSDSLVDFTDTSEIGDARIERWIWDFGDGAESNDPDTSHRFAEEGEWNVTLEVVDANGLSSKAEGTVEIESGAGNSGDGAIGLGDIADKVIETVERTAKGSLVVLLVIGMFVVLTMIGGRVVRQGVRILRPLPDRISVKLRPKQLEFAMLESKSDSPSATENLPTTPAFPSDHDVQEVEQQPIEAGV
jgi:hypothetical protein